MSNREQAVQKALVALKSRNPYQRIAAVETLAKHRHIEAAQQVLEATYDRNALVRETAIWALGDLGSLIAIDQLSSLAADLGTSRQERWAAIHSLGMLGDIDSLHVLFHAYAQDDDIELRHVASRAILRFGENAVPLLTEYLNGQHADDATIRAAAAQLLGRLRSVTAVVPLLQVADEDEQIVRWDAVKALGDIADAKAVPFLIDLLEEDDMILSQVTVWALECISTPEAIAAASEWRERNAFSDDGDDSGTPPVRPANS